MVIIEKYEFTYQDYLNYSDSFYCHETEEEYLCLAEPDVEYNYNEEIQKENDGDKKHDKIFKDILQNKDEMSKFINAFTEYNIKQEELEIYNSNYITKKFEYKNADIVYKIKEKDIYFLVEHQTKVDYSMAYRMLNYCVEIIKSAVKSKEINKVSYRYPKVIPIVLYTGHQKWTASKSFSQIQTEDKNFETKNIDAKYQLIDINEYEIDELLEQKSMLANAMILEKSKTFKDISDNLTMILENTPKGEKREDLKRIVMFLYSEIKEENKKELTKIIEESEGEENMLTAKRIIDAEFKKQRTEGIAKGIAKSVKKIVKKMIKMNFEDETIKEVTGAKKTEIEKIRKEMAK